VVFRRTATFPPPLKTCGIFFSQLTLRGVTVWLTRYHRRLPWTSARCHFRIDMRSHGSWSSYCRKAASLPDSRTVMVAPRARRHRPTTRRGRRQLVYGTVTDQDAQAKWAAGPCRSSRCPDTDVRPDQGRVIVNLGLADCRSCTGGRRSSDTGGAHICDKG